MVGHNTTHHTEICISQAKISATKTFFLITCNLAASLVIGCVNGYSLLCVS